MTHPLTHHISGDTPLYRCLVEDRQVGSYSHNHSHSQGGTGYSHWGGDEGGGGGGGGLYDHVESFIPKDTHFQSGSWTRKVIGDDVIFDVVMMFPTFTLLTFTLQHEYTL